MSYYINLWNKKSIQVSNEEHELIKRAIISKEADYVEIGGQLVNIKDIRGTEHTNDRTIIPDKFQLKEGKFEPVSKEYLEKWGEELKKKMKWVKK